MGIQVKDLGIRIGSSSIVSNINISIQDGERVGIVGASGSGKSMISRAIMGLLPQNAELTGSIRIDGQELVGASDAQVADLRGRTISMIFQNPLLCLNPVLTVEKQIELPLKLHYSLPKEKRQLRVNQALERVGLELSLKKRYPHELSGGQQQRVAIAAALVGSPRYIVADEPTTALDSLTRLQIVKLLVSLVEDARCGLLFVTHDFSVLKHCTKRCYVLDDGYIVDEDTTQGLLAHPKCSQTKRLVEAASRLSLHKESESLYAKK